MNQLKLLTTLSILPLGRFLVCISLVLAVHADRAYCEDATTTVVGEVAFSTMGGIGAVLDVAEEGAMLKSVFPNSPAARAGLLPGEIIMAVNSMSVEEFDLQEIPPLLRGPVGSTVMVTITRSGWAQPVTVEVTRDDLTTLLAASDPSFVPENWRGPNIQALNQITLPSDSTKEQVVEYVNRIAAASAGQTAFSFEDPQIGMLTEVGSGNIDALLNAPASLSFYIVSAISGLADDEHKQMIIDALPKYVQLIHLIVQKGWVDDARPILIAVLHTHPGYLPREWIDIVAAFQDPSTYDDLKEYLVNGANRLWTYEALSRIPGIDLSRTVAEAWAKAKFGCSDRERAAMATIALRFGHQDALRYSVGRATK
jgi:hypothetical protein